MEVEGDSCKNNAAPPISSCSSSSRAMNAKDDFENLLGLLKERDLEIVNLKEQLNICQEQLANANSEKKQLQEKIVGLAASNQQEKTVCDVESSFASVAVQVPEESSLITESEDKPMPEWNVNPSDSQTNPSLIADILRETVEEEIQNQGKEISCNNEDGSHQYEDHDNVASSEYIYDSNSGFYYHPATGYYWDPSSGLFYDYTSGLYYWYNEKTQAYEVHSGGGADTSKSSVSRTVKPSSKVKIREKRKYPNDTTGGKLRRRRKERRNVYRKDIDRSPSMNAEEEDMECHKKCIRKLLSDVTTNESVNTVDDRIPKIDTVNALMEEEKQILYESDSSGSLASGESELVSEVESGELISSSEDSDVEIIEDAPDSDFLNPEEFTKEMAEDYPPCIRFIVQESESLPLGTLCIVTCAGGSIGREASLGHALLIPDTSVSKSHAEIVYDFDGTCYKVQDVGSQNGTMINERRLSESKNKSSSQALSHCDILQIGNNTKLLVHIHKGHETCEDCEPGQVQAKLKANRGVKNNYQVLSKEERRLQQKSELKRIKKKFGLQNSYFENPGAVINKSEYTDKASLRRTLVGSENDNMKFERPANVHSPINASNKGHKLLAKMGWKEGEGLGKSNAGIAEPINVELRLNKSAGLGSNQAASLSIDNLQQASKAKRWNQARQRFNKLTAGENDLNTYTNKMESSSNSTDTQCCNVLTSLSDTFSSPNNVASPPEKNEKGTQRSRITWVKGETQHPS